MIAMLLATEWGKNNLNMALLMGFIGDICIAMILLRVFGE